MRVLDKGGRNGPKWEFGNRLVLLELRRAVLDRLPLSEPVVGPTSEVLCFAQDDSGEKRSWGGRQRLLRAVSGGERGRAEARPYTSELRRPMSQGRCDTSNVARPMLLVRCCSSATA